MKRKIAQQPSDRGLPHQKNFQIVLRLIDRKLNGMIMNISRWWPDHTSALWKERGGMTGLTSLKKREK